MVPGEARCRASGCRPRSAARRSRAACRGRSRCRRPPGPAAVRLRGLAVRGRPRPARARISTRSSAMIMILMLIWKPAQTSGSDRRKLNGLKNCLEQPIHRRLVAYLKIGSLETSVVRYFFASLLIVPSAISALSALLTGGRSVSGPSRRRCRTARASRSGRRSGRRRSASSRCWPPRIGASKMAASQRPLCDLLEHDRRRLREAARVLVGRILLLM